MKVFSKLFTSTNISSMTMFLGFLILYTIISNIEPNIFIIVIITILFWVANSLQVIKENKK
ncbi:hypothetical protein AM499_06775 [Bacillus sp. FJAT-22090]|nr:hypothetical protein AM499_06775 [Bacillus sp. FJAT-22090]